MILWTAAQSSHFPAKMITNKLSVRGIAYVLCIFYAETSTLVKAHLKGGGVWGEENSLGYEFSWCLLLLYSPPDNYCTVVVCFILGIQSPRIALSCHDRCFDVSADALHKEFIGRREK